MTFVASQKKQEIVTTTSLNTPSTPLNDAARHSIMVAAVATTTALTQRLIVSLHAQDVVNKEVSFSGDDNHR